ncbi:MAG: hypothetical protein Q7J30_02405 [Candidatus Azambacteria bacterium]|nr:hypothetical protein [Candidatus Azambacteria bacterium]
MNKNISAREANDALGVNKLLGGSVGASDGGGRGGAILSIGGRDSTGSC